jgi:hypothetical protein
VDGSGVRLSAGGSQWGGSGDAVNDPFIASGAVKGSFMAFGWAVGGCGCSVPRRGVLAASGMQ